MLEHILTDWATALFVPIYKKGEQHKPDSYRPIALQSHVRKIIEASIAKLILRNYKINEQQLGFRTGTGTETAIVRHIHCARTMKITAVLDLKSAYDSVPKENLYKTVEASQNDQVMSMILFALQPVTLTTRGERSGTTAKIAKRVCQGLSLSPKLFNM